MTRWRQTSRVVFALLAIAACLLLMRDAARIGFSRLLTRYAVVSNSIPAADQAIQLTPTDAEAHRARATVLNRLRRLEEAQTSLQLATDLRPRDYRSWLELGNTRDDLGNTEDALKAMNEAVRWAPYYAEPRWQRGNLLVRLGRDEDAFTDLRYAASRNKKFLPNLIDLAWGLSYGQALTTERLLQISNDNDRLVFARFLAQKGKGADVAEQVRLLNAPLSAENKEELVRLLVAARQYKDALGLWNRSEDYYKVINGGFEEPLSNTSYFGWVFYEGPAKPKFAIDVSEKFGGAKSLQITLDGVWDPGTALLSQIIVVQPRQRYRLNFAVKTKNLVTGGPPCIVLTDETQDQILRVGSSETFPRDTNSWQQMSIEFTSVASVLQIRLTRENCTSAACPIFGVLWLDEFSLQML